MNHDLVAKRLGALGNPTRLAIYRALVRAGHDGLAVGDLQQRIDVPSSTLSHHLHKLISVGLVAQERQATTLICRANYAAMDETLGFLTEECCVDAVSQKGRSALEHA
jgi:ArsR family transcriptional regulator